MTSGEAASWAHQVFGGWSNLFQGAIGSLIGTLVGVLGAYIVARWTTRRELDLQRQEARRREQAEAAERLLTALFDLESHVVRLKRGDLLNHRDYALQQLEAWNFLTDRLRREVTSDLDHLPADLLKHLSELEGQLASLYAVEEDGEGWPLHIEMGHPATKTRVIAGIDGAVFRLLLLRSRRSDPVKRQSWRRRLWVPWALAGVLSGALVLVAVFD